MTPLKAKRPRCTATKADGSPCTNKAKASSDRCGAHNGKVGAPVKLPSDPFLGGVGKQSYTDAICELAGIGSTRNRIARELHLAPATLMSWLERGEADSVVEQATEFRDLYDRFECSRANFVTKQLRRLDKAGDEDWRAAVKLLEVVLSDEFGPKAKLEHSGDINLVEQHADQILEAVMPILTDLGMAFDPRVPDLIEKYFTPLERPGNDF